MDTITSLQLGISLQVGAWNPGDLLPTYCARSLMARASAPLSLDSWFLHEQDPPSLKGFDFADYDLAAVLCTPWLWDRAAPSPKYGILRDFTSRIRAGTTMAIGVGSSFLLHHIGLGERYPGQNEVMSCGADWNAFDLVVCRDRLAAALFREMLPRERVLLRPCPSFYSAATFGVAHEPTSDHLLVFSDIQTSSYWGVAEDDLRRANIVQDDLIRSGTPVMTMFERDSACFTRRYGRPPDIDVRRPDDILRALSRYHAMTSARVHACMPALSLGLATRIIPLDSRSLTAIGLGAEPIGNSLQLLGDFAEPIDRMTEDQYVDDLRMFANRASPPTPAGLATA